MAQNLKKQKKQTTRVTRQVMSAATSSFVLDWTRKKARPIQWAGSTLDHNAPRPVYEKEGLISYLKPPEYLPEANDIGAFGCFFLLQHLHPSSTVDDGNHRRLSNSKMYDLSIDLHRNTRGTSSSSSSTSHHHGLSE